MSRQHSKVGTTETYDVAPGKDVSNVMSTIKRAGGVIVRSSPVGNGGYVLHVFWGE